MIELPRVFDEPAVLYDRVRAYGPCWNQARYVPPSAAGAFAPGHPLVRDRGRDDRFDGAPVFRADWYRWGEGSTNGQEIAGHGPFADAARRLSGRDHVVPFLVHVNLNVPGPVFDAGHVDVPAFRGLDRRNAPGWVLLALARAGLAEAWRLQVTTAVSWLYRGGGGGFTSWRDGPTRDPVTIDRLWNRAVVLDADRIHHRVEPVGCGDDPVGPLTRESSIRAFGLRSWLVDDGAGGTVELDLDEVRISISWKAAVFETEADVEGYVGGDDLLSIEAAAALLRDEVRARGLDLSDDVPVDDPRFVTAVERAIPRVVPLRFAA